MPNLSQLKRQRMLAFLDKIKEEQMDSKISYSTSDAHIEDLIKQLKKDSKYSNIADFWSDSRTLNSRTKNAYDEEIFVNFTHIFSKFFAVFFRGD